MCTGYLADQFEHQFGDGNGSGIQIEYSREPQAMGTGGAVKLASHNLQKEAEFLVMNGDSFIEMDFQRLLEFHREQKAFLSMAVRQVSDTSRYGRVEINAAGRVISFTEKASSNGPGLVNAGAYVFSRDVLKQIPDGPASLERDVFPKLLDRGIYAMEQQGMFIDIGTPEDYARAQEICGRLYAAALNRSS
jgi:NDP-sugar pyrophosphorylase family protein